MIETVVTIKKTVYNLFGVNPFLGSIWKYYNIELSSEPHVKKNTSWATIFSTPLFCTIKYYYYLHWFMGFMTSRYKRHLSSLHIVVDSSYIPRVR